MENNLKYQFKLKSESRLMESVYSLVYTALFLIYFSGAALAATPDIPSGLKLEVSGTGIKASWTANTDNTEGY